MDDFEFVNTIINGENTALGREIIKKSIKYNKKEAVHFHVTAFYNNYDEFTESKKFVRFMDFISKEIDNFFNGFGVLRATADRRNITEARLGFKELVRDAIGFHTAIKCDKEEDETQTNPQLGTISILNIIGKIPERTYSNLWYFNDIIKDAGAEKIALDEDGEPLVLQQIGLILTGYDADTKQSVFDSVYEDALKRACYDYAVSKILINHLTEETWLVMIKKITPEQLITIAAKIFEYALHNAEDYAACHLIYSKDDKNGDSFFKDLINYVQDKEKFDSIKEEQDKIIEALNQTVKAKDEKIGILTEKYEQLNKMVTSFESDKQNTVELQKELKKIKEEYNKLNEKYDSLLQFTEQLEAPVEEDEPQEDAAAMPLDETIRSKRIVFIRDKKYDNCFIMRKLYEYFYNAKFTNGIASEINANATDLIVVLTQYVCHGTYWGAKSISERKNIPMLNCRKVNLNTIVEQISKAI